VKATSELLQAGSFTVASAIELKHIQLTLLKKGAHAGTEQFRVKLYPDSTYTTPIYTSSWFALTDIDGITSSSWMGWVRVDFANRVHLSTQQTYFVGIESTGYTRNGDTLYLAFKTDWPDAVHASGGNEYLAAQIRLIGYR
jgi:hypothetical protein